MNTKIVATSAIVAILAACGPAVAQQNNSDTQTQTAPAAPGPYGQGPYGMHPGMGYGPGYGMGPGMMYGQGYGMGPGMMYGRGYGMMGYGMGPGMMGRGMMGYGMGPGMMGYGMGPGMMGRAAPAENLTKKDVKANLERWLSWMNNPNLKVGKIQEKDKNTITAEIVTKDNSLVRRFEIDRATGFMRPIG